MTMSCEPTRSPIRGVPNIEDSSRVIASIRTWHEEIAESRRHMDEIERALEGAFWTPQQMEAMKATAHPPAEPGGEHHSRKEKPMNDVNPAPVERPAYQVRVIEEKFALDEKLGKLQVFLESAASSAAKDRVLLVEQANAMGTYSAILGQRIQRFEVVEQLPILSPEDRNAADLGAAG